MFYWLAKNTTEAFMIAAESDRRETPRAEKRAPAPDKQWQEAPARGEAVAFPGACGLGLSGLGLSG